MCFVHKSRCPQASAPQAWRMVLWAARGAIYLLAQGNPRRSAAARRAHLKSYASARLA